MASISTTTFAGWEIHFGGGGMMSPTAVYIQKNMMRQDMGQLVTIMDINKEWIYYLNPARKTYWSGPVSQMHKTGQDEAQTAIEKMLKDLPPAQRELMKKAMEQQGPSRDEIKPRVNSDVKKTNRTDIIAGHKSQQYEIYTNGELFMELWVAKSVPIAKEMDIKKLIKMMAQMSQSGPGENPMSSPKVQALWKEGYPLRQITHFMGRPNTSEATKVKQKPIPSSLFKVPEDYRKVGGVMEVMQ